MIFGLIMLERVSPVENASPSYRGHRHPQEIISHCVWLCFRFPLSFREVEELMLERGVIVSYETIHRWCLKFGHAYAYAYAYALPAGGPARATSSTSTRSSSVPVSEGVRSVSPGQESKRCCHVNGCLIIWWCVGAWWGPVPGLGSGRGGQTGGAGDAGAFQSNAAKLRLLRRCQAVR